VDVLLYTILTGLFTIYWIILLVDCLRLRALDRKTRLIWIAVIVLGGPPVGALIYHGARSSLLKAAAVGSSRMKTSHEESNRPSHDMNR
jgi:hypothetical protein